MKILKNVPFSREEIDPAWLTSALRDSGVIAEEEVVDVTHRVIGEEAGFLGEVAILNLKYSDPASTAPASMVLKIPTALKNRVMGQLMGVYEKEIRFYNQLQPELSIRSPRHYYSALSAADDPGVVLERLKKLDQQPIWVIALLAVVMRWLFGLMPRRYVLLIEDVSHHRLGDQSQDSSDDDVERALTTLARLHGQFWGSEALDKMSWISPVDLTGKLIEIANKQAIKKYREANAASLSDSQYKLLDWIEANGLELTALQGRHPRTLLHGDFRVDNLCFDDTAGEALVLDWQTMVAGSGGMDLAYFLSNALPLEASEERVNELIEFYRQGLAREGVEISFERLRWLYELGMLSMLQKIAPILFQEQLELGSERGPEVMQGWVNKTYRRLESVQYLDILARNPA
jgi:thiamine kinase-like enzyme